MQLYHTVSNIVCAGLISLQIYIFFTKKNVKITDYHKRNLYISVMWLIYSHANFAHEAYYRHFHTMFAWILVATINVVNMFLSFNSILSVTKTEMLKEFNDRLELINKNLEISTQSLNIITNKLEQELKTNG